MTDFNSCSFNTGKTWKAPEYCDHGWDGQKYWLTPKGACVKCGATNVEPHVAAINASIEFSLSHAKAHTATVVRLAQICPKCKSKSGDDWSQCEGSCPMKMSPHYKPKCDCADKLVKLIPCKVCDV